jgi:cysteine desulfurase/selenocysteine lyase
MNPGVETSLSACSIRKASMSALPPRVDEDRVARYRKEFPICQNLVYMNHAGVAPTSLRVCQAVRASLEALANYGVDFPGWERNAALCRQRFANLIGSLPEEVAFVRNTSHGLGLVAEGLNWKAGDGIAVATDIEYPSNVHVWRHLVESRDIQIHSIPAAEGAVTVDAVASVLKSKKTRLVAVSSAQFGTGGVTDLVALGQLCRERDVLLCVDAIQTVGALPIDVKKMGIHFLAADSHKWMLGMMGMGALYVDERLSAQMRPALVGWKSMVKGWDFNNQDFDLWPHAGRFEEGSPTYAMIEGLSAALELLQEISVEAISCRLRALTARLVAGLEKLQCDVGPLPEHRHHIVSFTYPGIEATEFEKALRERHIVVTARKGRVRVSPHFYNTLQEVDSVIEAVQEIISKSTG